MTDNKLRVIPLGGLGEFGTIPVSYNGVATRETDDFLLKPFRAGAEEAGPAFFDRGIAETTESFVDHLQSSLYTSGDPLVIHGGAFVSAQAEDFTLHQFPADPERLLVISIAGQKVRAIFLLLPGCPANSVSEDVQLIADENKRTITA